MSPLISLNNALWKPLHEHVWDLIQKVVIKRGGHKNFHNVTNKRTWTKNKIKTYQEATKRPLTPLKCLQEYMTNTDHFLNVTKIFRILFRM